MPYVIDAVRPEVAQVARIFCDVEMLDFYVVCELVVALRRFKF